MVRATKCGFEGVAGGDIEVAVNDTSTGGSLALPHFEIATAERELLGRLEPGV